MWGNVGPRNRIGVTFGRDVRPSGGSPGPCITHCSHGFILTKPVPHSLMRVKPNLSMVGVKKPGDPSEASRLAFLGRRLLPADRINISSDGFQLVRLQ